MQCDHQQDHLRRHCLVCVKLYSNGGHDSRPSHSTTSPPDSIGTLILQHKRNAICTKVLRAAPIDSIIRTEVQCGLNCEGLCNIQCSSSPYRTNLLLAEVICQLIAILVERNRGTISDAGIVW